MPNWCYNTLQVCGKEAEMTRFKEAVRTDTHPLKFGTTRPMPEFNQEDKKDYKPLSLLVLAATGQTIDLANCKDWYTWTVAAWGTKWDLDESTKFEEEAKGLLKKPTLRYVFDTAWAPPIAWLEFTSALFPMLLFKLSCVYEDGKESFFIVNGNSSYDYRQGYAYLREIFKIKKQQLALKTPEVATKIGIHIV